MIEREKGWNDNEYLVVDRQLFNEILSCNNVCVTSDKYNSFS